MNTKYIGHLKAGDVIQCTDANGLVITVTLTSISVDPTWHKTGGVLIGYHHEPSGANGFLNLDNLVRWFADATWHKVTA